VDKACEIGIDVFRCFDALNDFRNMESCAERIKANGKQFQGAVCYSLTDVRMGGEVYNLEYFVAKAKELEQMGADAICIKDMGGILSPYDAYDLVSAIKKEVKLPLHLHSHYTSGMASMTYLKAIEAGVDVVDTCLAPFALRTSMPAIEPLVAALQGTERASGIDLNKLLVLGEHLESIAPKYSSHLATNKLSIIDNGVLAHQIPGGMISNLTGQLKEMNALNRLGEIYIEVVLNVLFGRYVRVSNQLKDLVLGLYGKTPMPIDPELTKKILKNYKRGQVPVSGRPADYLEPEIEAAKKNIGNLARNDEDVLAYILYPATMEKFLRTKYGIDSPAGAGVKNSPKKEFAA
jgi:pyruvate/oxaloacetate carboxyltransferase